MREISRLCLMTASLVAAVIALSVVPVLAENYPNRPVQLVVGYPAGGAGEFAAALISDKLSAALGKPVNVEYRPGGSGATAAQGVAHAPPDGHVLLLGQTPEIAINPHIVKDLGYDPEKDLQPIALIIEMPIALVVGSSASYASVADLIDGARSSSRGLLFFDSRPGVPGTSPVSCCVCDR